MTENVYKEYYHDVLHSAVSLLKEKNRLKEQNVELEERVKELEAQVASSNSLIDVAKMSRDNIAYIKKYTLKAWENLEEVHDACNDMFDYFDSFKNTNLEVVADGEAESQQTFV